MYEPGRSGLLMTGSDDNAGRTPEEVSVSLAERLVVLHLGSTAVLLVLLSVVTAVRHAWEAVAARRRPVTAQVQGPVLPQQVVVAIEPRVIDLRPSRQPSVAGAAHRTS